MAARLSTRTSKPAARRKRNPAVRQDVRLSAGTLRLGGDLVLELVMSSRIAGLVLLVGCLAGLAYLGLDDRFYVYAPVVTGNQYTDSDDIVAASGLEGLHVAWVQPERMAQTLLKRLPDLREAKVTCRLPGDCALQVVERQPLFAWRQDTAQAWVDAEGMVFVAHGQLPRLPVIDITAGGLPLPGTRVDRDLLAGMQALVRLLPDLRALRYTPERGLEFSDPVGGWPVYLGSGPDMEARVAVWHALSEQLAGQGGRLTFVDVRYVSAPYYGTR